MEYNLLFGDGFDFVKGGKLPGLYGGHTRYGGHRIKFSFQKVKLLLLWDLSHKDTHCIFSTEEDDTEKIFSVVLGVLIQKIASQPGQCYLLLLLLFNQVNLICYFRCYCYSTRSTTFVICLKGSETF